MHVISKVSIAALTAFAAMPALAQDERPPFTGPRVEVIGGYDNVQPGDDNSDDAAEGFTYGVGLGYDFQIGGAVLGIEAELADSTGKITGRDIDISGDSLRLESDRDIYVGGRVGFAVGPSTLLYAKGGYTNFRVQSRYENSTGTVFDQGVTLDGWRAGLGLEHRFSLLGPSGFIKAEYRYSHYGNINLDNVNADIDVDRHQAVLGVGFRF
ncbi:MAG TPA: porin family protein [Sphingobium sp.]